MKRPHIEFELCWDWDAFGFGFCLHRGFKSNTAIAFVLMLGWLALDIWRRA